MIADLKPYPAMKDSGVEWLGEVPAHWEVKRGKNIFNCIDVRSKTGEEELLTVSSSRGIVPRRSANVTMFKAESYIGHKLCWPNDLVINSLWAWACGLGVSNHHGIISTAYSVYRPNKSVDPRFIHQFVRSTPFHWELRVRSKGVWTSRLQLTDDSFLGAPFALPPLPEQAAIVRYLDHMDRRVRRLVRAKRKLIALLTEQKQAIIHRAVTRGLDPNIPLKDSGVEWLGEMPAHWEVRRSKRTFTPRKELARPDDIQLSATQAYGVIAQDEYERRVGRKIVKIFRHLEKRRHVELDDFVISMRSFQGGLERAWVSGCIRSSYIVLRPTIQVDVGFFSYLFKSRGYIGALQSTADFIRDGQDLNFDNFCGVDLPVPPIKEQRRIAEILDEAVGNANKAAERAQKEIELLNEFRTRLIADVVTGKLDVRKAAAALPEIVPPDTEGDLDDALETDVETDLDDLAAIFEEAEA